MILVNILAHVGHNVLLKFSKFEELSQVNKIELVLVSEAQVVFNASDVIEQVLDIPVILASLQAALVVDDDLYLRGILPVLLALRLFDVDGVEDVLSEFESEALSDLDQLVWIHVY